MQEELRLRRLASALASDDHRREVEERADQLRQVRLVSLFQRVERSFGAIAPTSAMIKSNLGERFSLLMIIRCGARRETTSPATVTWLRRPGPSR